VSCLPDIFASANYLDAGSEIATHHHESPRDQIGIISVRRLPARLDEASARPHEGWPFVTFSVSGWNPYHVGGSLFSSLLLLLPSKGRGAFDHSCSSEKWDTGRFINKLNFTILGLFLCSLLSLWYFFSKRLISQHLQFLPLPLYIYSSCCGCSGNHITRHPDIFGCNIRSNYSFDAVKRLVEWHPPLSRSWQRCCHLARPPWPKTG
jgi:hypothetical protein